MKIRTYLGAFVVLASLSAHAQTTKPAIIAEGGTPDDRASARVLYWNNQKNASAGQLAIDYGRPVWKPAYEDAAKFDAMTKGKTWRLGSNFWTAIDTNLPLKLSGREVAPGYYYLGLHRSADGSKWSLAFYEPMEVRALSLDAFDVNKGRARFEVPMTIAETGTKAERLTITLSYPKDDIRKVTLKVAWGTLTLTTPIDVTVSE
jgi:hypothetical protein